MNDAIRIDKFLWFARFAKSRALAQQIVEKGRIRISGRAVQRTHHPVHVGDIITFLLHDKIRVIRIEAIPKRRGPAAEARICYSDLAPAPAATDDGQNANVSQMHGRD